MEYISYDHCMNNKNPMLGFTTFKELVNLTEKNGFTEVVESTFEEDRCKLFTIDEKMDFLFMNTKSTNIKETLKLPFDVVFLSICFPLDEKNMVTGIWLFNKSKKMKKKMTKVSKKLIGKKLMIPNISSVQIYSKIFRDKEDGETIEVDSFSVDVDLKTKKIIPPIINYSEEDRKLDIPINRKCKPIIDYVFNFLLFMNEPRVVTYIVSPNNKRRERKGLIPIPSLLKTRITPELKEYINVNYQSHSKFGFKFDVRAHWRVLRHQRFKDSVGKKIWIPAHMRGEGLKVPQIHSVEAS